MEEGQMNDNDSPPGNIKRVTFYETVICRKIISRHDYSKDEAHRSWFSQEEMNKMTERRSQTIERMESGKHSRLKSTYRGLEGLSVKGQAEMEGIIRHCVDAVLDEQDRQVYLGVWDDEMIALVSSQSSEECMLKAIQQARSDEREAKRCYRRLKDLEDCSSSILNSDHSSSSISIGDEYPIQNIIPILKTGNLAVDIHESAMQTLDVTC